jgi:hypothetical protein
MSINQKSLFTLGVGFGFDDGAALGVWPVSAENILHGDADLEYGSFDVSGAGAVSHQPSQYVGARPGGRHGVIPSTSFIVAEYQRQEIDRQLARIITGNAAVDCSGAEVSALGRIKSVQLVASVDCAVSAECDATGEFIDVELEMLTLLLAA